MCINRYVYETEKFDCINSVQMTTEETAKCKGVHCNDATLTLYYIGSQQHSSVLLTGHGTRDQVSLDLQCKQIPEMNTTQQNQNNVKVHTLQAMPTFHQS